MSNKRAKRQTARCRGRSLRFGVIGAGGMGQGYCRIMSTIPYARLAAVCDLNRPAAEEAAVNLASPALAIIAK